VPLKQIEAQQVQAPTSEPGILLTNPPYGERIGVRGDASLEEDELAKSFYSAFSGTLKQRFAGWTAYFFTADLGLPKLLRLKESRKTPFFNGALECRLFRFDMVAGFNRRPGATPAETMGSDPAIVHEPKRMEPVHSAAPEAKAVPAVLQKAPGSDPANVHERGGSGAEAASPWAGAKPGGSEPAPENKMRRAPAPAAGGSGSRGSSGFGGNGPRGGGSRGNNGGSRGRG